MVYCMSDIHGEIEKFHAMLQLIQFSKEDTLYILGDAIDRKPDGISILQEIIATPNIVMLRGNHEQMCYDTLSSKNTYGAKELWKQNGGRSTYREMVYYMTAIGRKQILEFIAQMPTQVNIKVGSHKFCLVHGWPSHDEDQRLWGRPMDGLGIMWSEDVIPIIGHTPTIYLYPNDGKSPFHIYRSPFGYVAIDCGCGNDTGRRRLACLRLDDMQEFYV